RRRAPERNQNRTRARKHAGCTGPPPRPGTLPRAMRRPLNPQENVMPADPSVVQPLDSTPSAPSAPLDVNVVPLEERALALVAHLSTAVMPVLGPAVTYFIALARRSPGHGRQHAATALNFHLTSMMMWLVVSGILWWTGLGGWKLTETWDNLWPLVM